MISAPCLKRIGCDDLGVFGSLEHETHSLALSIVSLRSWESSSIASEAPKNRKRSTVSVITDAKFGLSGMSSVT